MDRESIASRVARGKKVLLGVVHLPALPGSPRFESRDEVLAIALADAEALVAGGLDGFIVENFGDFPFEKDRVPVAVVAEMAVLVERLRRAVGDAPLIGVNVLRNDAMAALAVAGAAGGDFLRVNVLSGVMFTDQGIMEGRAAELARERRRLGCSVEILADVAVKHATPPPGFSLEQSAKDTAYRALADGLIVTGSGTGAAAEVGDVKRVRGAVPDRPLFVGSGVSADSIAGVLAVADGIIVGTALKERGRVELPVARERVRELVERARA